MFGIPEWALGVGFIILMAGIGRVLVARYAPSALKAKAGQREIGAAVEELKDARLAEVDDLQRRLTDVEERLDFTERMLSQQRDAQRLGSSQK